MGAAGKKGTSERADRDGSIHHRTASWEREEVRSSDPCPVSEGRQTHGLSGALQRDRKVTGEAVTHGTDGKQTAAWDERAELGPGKPFGPGPAPRRPPKAPAIPEAPLQVGPQCLGRLLPLGDPAQASATRTPTWHRSVAAAVSSESRGCSASA